jgi:hypothetical protein
VAVKLGSYVVWAAVATGTGILVLLGYFIEVDLLIRVRLLLIQWAVLLAAAALLLGLFNLLAVHWSKVSMQDDGWPYSALLILFFLVTLVLGLLFGPDYEVVLLLFRYVQVPIEASLLALLAVSLTLAGFRIFAQRRDLLSVTFMGVSLLVLIGTAPWPFAGDSVLALAVSDIRAWVTQVWASAGARGILLGVALGAITTGLRVLLASDRPYGD